MTSVEWWSSMQARRAQAAVAEGAVPGLEGSGENSAETQKTPTTENPQNLSAPRTPAELLYLQGSGEKIFKGIGTQKIPSTHGHNIGPLQVPAENIGEIEQPSSADAPNGPPPVPFLTSDGTLVIPFASDPKYHWWKGGQSAEKTRAELDGI